MVTTECRSDFVVFYQSVCADAAGCVVVIRVAAAWNISKRGKPSAMLHNACFLACPVTVLLIGAFVMCLLALGGSNFHLHLAS